MTEIDERFILNDDALDELYAWIDTIPLSRPKKNIARDFSDGVLVAETVAHFLPKLVDMHNYFSANATGQKKINWNTLNRRVFSKMGIRISESTIQQLIDAKAGAIEQVLWDLRRKINEEQQSPQMSSARSRSVPLRSKSPAPSSYFKQNGVSGNQLVQKQQEPVDREIIEPINLDVRGSGTQQSLSSPSRSGSTLGSYSQSSQQPTHGYVVPPSINTSPNNNNEEPSNNNSSTGPPAQIIYRGHKMIPLALLDEKDREIKAVEFTNKNLIVKVHRLETLINVKDQRIEDLTHQLHNLRAIYERVTQQTWQGFQ